MKGLGGKEEVEWKVLVAGAVRRLFFGDGEIDLISTRRFRVCVCVCDVPCPPRVVCDVGFGVFGEFVLDAAWCYCVVAEDPKGERDGPANKAYGLLGSVMGDEWCMSGVRGREVFGVL